VHDLRQSLQLPAQCRQLAAQVCPDAGQARGDRRQIRPCSWWPLLQCFEPFGQCRQCPPCAAVALTFALQRSVQPLSIGSSWGSTSTASRLRFVEGFRQAAYNEQVDG
jgi:hypothetical protein